jgi:hypothetical protein
VETRAPTSFSRSRAVYDIVAAGDADLIGGTLTVAPLTAEEGQGGPGWVFEINYLNDEHDVVVDYPW